MSIFDDEDQVESRKNSRLKIDIVARALHIIIPSKNRIRSSKNTTPRIQNRRNPGLGNTNRLLFHSLMNRHTIFIPHFIEFVDTHDPAVRKDHCPTLEVEFAGIRVALDGGGETGCGGAFAGGVDCNGGDFFDEFEELGFCCTGVPEEENVDVAPEFHAIWEDFLGAAE